MSFGPNRHLQPPPAHVLAEDVPDGALALAQGPPDPQGLDQLGVGDDQVLPVDEEDGHLLLAQHVGGAEGPDEHLGNFKHPDLPLKRIYLSLNEKSFCSFSGRSTKYTSLY